MNISKKLSVLHEILKVLERKQKKKLILLSSIQIFLGAFDLVGVAIFGVLGALTVSGVQSQSPTSRVLQVLRILHLENMTFQKQAAILGILAVSFLILRTAMTVFITKRTFRFLSNRGAEVSSQLIKGLLNKQILFIQSKTNQELLYGVTQGVMTLVIGVIATLTNLVSDVGLLIILGFAMYIIDPVIAFSSFLIFGSVAAILYKVLHEKARALGSRDSKLQVDGNSKIIEVLQTFRESVVHDRRNYYAKEIGKIRVNLAQTQAESSFLPYVSKYVIESTVILGALIIAGIQFAIHDAVTAAATLSVFMVAGTRISPAVLRIQQGLIQIKSSVGGSELTLDLLREIPLEKMETIEDPQPSFEYSDDFHPNVVLQNVNFTYPNSRTQALQNINLDLPAGSIVAFVGPSGGGKSTLADLILGVLSPESGTVLISNSVPENAVKDYPGAISYVPQQVVIVDGSIRENVSLGYKTDGSFDEQISAAMQRAGLGDFLRDAPSQLDTQLGEWGARISGGQRQRIGIARALFTNPKLLVLDEATSALDGETEAGITDEIMKMKGRITVILIAHRLSTIAHVDRVYYIADGEIKADGTFNEVRAKVPEFNQQANLMGL